MHDFGLINFRSASEAPRAGVLADGSVFALPDRIGDISISTLADMYARWTEIRPALDALDYGRGTPVGDIELLAPSLTPSGIYCAGTNYQEHADAVARQQHLVREPTLPELGLPPWHFLKAQNTLRGHGSAIALVTDHVDWEIELAAIIGRRARNVSIDSALDYVAGYTVAIDLSARDRAFRAKMALGSPFRMDWIAQKSFEGACPLGPRLVPADRIGDPNQLPLRLSVNGRVRQNSNTNNMTFSTAAQIAHLSTVITLSPGDVILTGTPAGTGFETDEYLQLGDIVTASIAGIGELTITMVASDDAPYVR